MAHVVAFSIGNMARHNIRTQSPVAAHLQPIAVHRYKTRGQAPKIIAQLNRSFAVCRTVSGADVTFAAILLHLPVPSNGLCARVSSALPGSHDPLKLKILSSPQNQHQERLIACLCIFFVTVRTKHLIAKIRSSA